MFMDICNPSENSCFSKIFPVLLKCDFSWFQPIIGRFYKMRVSWELTFTTFLSPFINTVLCFLTWCEYYLWLDSKYNVRRCDVLVQNKTIHSLNLSYPWSNISLKMATWAIGKTHVIRGRVVCIIVFIVSIWSDLLVFCWWFMSNIRNVFTNSIGYVTKCGPAGILEGNTTDRCMGINVLKSSYRKIWSNILTARWRASAWSDKMNKEQSADDPSVDLIRVKHA